MEQIIRPSGDYHNSDPAKATRLPENVHQIKAGENRSVHFWLSNFLGNICNHLLIAEALLKAVRCDFHFLNVLEPNLAYGWLSRELNFLYCIFLWS